ncbi:MAG: hypothetical protein J6Y24_16180 [Bacteroidales bacterium]|nr:hypothetical protein [Bacteroidales bacterium]
MNNVKVLHDHFNSEREHGIWMPMDCFEGFCDTLEFIFDNYERFHSIVLKRAALWLKRLDWHPASDICKLLYNSDEQWVYFAYKDYVYELQMHGYENRLFIKDAKQEIRILRHSILCDETRLRTEFLAGNKVPTVSGAEYDEPTFCKILAAAIDKDEKVLEFEEVAREVITSQHSK